MYYSYFISDYFDNYTIREFLESFKISNAKINRIINEKLYCYPSDYLKKGTNLLIDSKIFNEVEINPLFKELKILYEDDYLLIVDKPQGIIIHSDVENAALDNIVAGIFKKRGIPAIPRHVYRLDKDTTGVMVYCKDPLTLAKLSNDVMDKSLTKEYLAIVNGIIVENNGTINKKIGKDRHQNNKMVISKTGKNAVTNYKVLERKDNKTLLSLVLETGRTHQIRLHLSYIGHSIVGDVIYGDGKGELMLQASKVSLIHPVNKKRLTIKVNHILTI